MLLQLSQFSPLCPLPLSAPHSLRPPHTMFTTMGYEYEFFGYSISYAVFYMPMAIL